MTSASSSTSMHARDSIEIRAAMVRPMERIRVDVAGKSNQAKTLVSVGFAFQSNADV